jgi:hypothetical protein
MSTRNSHLLHNLLEILTISHQSSRKQNVVKIEFIIRQPNQIWDHFFRNGGIIGYQEIHKKVKRKCSRESTDP